MEDLVQLPFSFQNSVYNYLFFFGLISAGIILARIITYALKHVLIRANVYSAETFIPRYRSVFTILFATIAANAGIGILKLPSKPDIIVDKVLHLVLIYAVTHFLIKSMSFLKLLLYHKFDIDQVHNLQERKARTQIDFLYKTGSVLLILISFAIAMMSFTKVRELGTSILASAGLAGIIIGLAAQKSISNLLAGIQIALTQPIRLDDAVIVEDQFGKIEEISLTYVVIKIWNEKRMIIPISYFIEKPFQNLTRTSAQMLDTVTLYADHSLPIDNIRIELKRILENEGSSLWDKRVSAVQLTDCSNSSIEVRILISADNSGAAFDLRCLIREKLIEYIRNNHPDCLPKYRYMRETETKVSNLI
ncbi:MAG: mechanosensitive ion channel [Opitutaceae bacterium]|nr:mechanosensitive ion channel [Cytophagales bacterium]